MSEGVKRLVGRENPGARGARNPAPRSLRGDAQGLRGTKAAFSSAPGREQQHSFSPRLGCPKGVGDEGEQFLGADAVIVPAFQPSPGPREHLRGGAFEHGIQGW